MCYNRTLVELAQENELIDAKSTNFLIGFIPTNNIYYKIGMYSIYKFDLNTVMHNVDYYQMFSLCNKNNKVYTKEEWISIFSMANSSDAGSRELAMSLIKNADKDQNILASMVWSILFQKENGKGEKFIGVNYKLFHKQYIHNHRGLDLLINCLSWASPIERAIINDPVILDIYIKVHRHWLDFGGVKVKENLLNG